MPYHTIKTEGHSIARSRFPALMAGHFGAGQSRFYDEYTRPVAGQIQTLQDRLCHALDIDGD